MQKEMCSSPVIKLEQNPVGFADEADDLDPEMFVSDLPTQHSHAFFEDESLGLYVGVWDTDDMIEAPGPYSSDEFMLLLEGKVRVKDNQSGEFATVAAGDAFILPKGYDCQWHQNGYLRKFYVISEHPEEPIPEQAAQQEAIIVPLSSDGSAASESVLFSGLGSNQWLESHAYTDTLDRFVAGVWQSGLLGAEGVTLHRYSLLCVRSGAIRLAVVDGEEHTLSAGESCFVLANTDIELSVSQNTSIQFCTVTP